MFSPNKSYVWSGRAQSGHIVEGVYKASQVASVEIWLRQQGITPLTVSIDKNAKIHQQKWRIAKKDISTFTSQMATTLNTGLDIMVALSLVYKSTPNPRLKSVIDGVLQEISEGSNLSDALRIYPNCFDNVYCELIASGESSGTLELMFERLANFLEKRQALHSKVKKATYYPVIVLFVSTVVTAILIGFVLPKFQSIYESMNTELPYYTQVVMTVSSYIAHYGLVALFITIVLVWGFMRWVISNERAHLWWTKQQLKLPIIGNIFKQAATIRFCQTLSTTYAAGTPLLQAVKASGAATGNVVFKHEISRIEQFIQHGHTLSYSFSKISLFSELTKQMIKIGEETGTLGKMLDKVAQIGEQELDDTIGGISATIEPIMISLLAILIGGLIIAMYLPIFNMGNMI